MIKTPLSTAIGGAFWTPGCTIIGGNTQSFSQLIKKLFANGEQGFAYDPNDLTTMFQDAAGTVPVTGAGQSVGLILDKSGRGNHARQTTSASRPILRQNATTGAYYLEFDGSDDFLVTNSIDFTGTNEVSLFAGVRKLSDVGNQLIVELSSNADVLGMAFKLSTESNGSTYFVVKGTSPSFIGRVDKSPVTLTFAAKASFSPSRISLNVNGNTLSPKTDSMGSGNFGNYPLYIGRRAGTSLPFNGHIYSLICIGRLTTDAETTAIEKELAKRTGVTLS
jgi:hypothetical protein